MDGTLFDRLTRVLGNGVSRRGVGVLAAGVLAGLADGPAQARPGNKRGGNKKNNKKAKKNKKNNRGGSATETRLLRCGEGGRGAPCAGCARCNNGDCCANAGSCSVSCRELCLAADADDDYLELHDFLLGEGFRLEVAEDDRRSLVQELWRGGVRRHSVLTTNRYHTGLGPDSTWANLFYVAHPSGARRAIAVKREGPVPIAIYTVGTAGQIEETAVDAGGNPDDVDQAACRAWCECDDGTDFIAIGVILAGAAAGSLARFYADAVATEWHLSAAIDETRSCAEICANPCVEELGGCDANHRCCPPLSCEFGFCAPPSQEPTCSESGAPCGLGLLPCCLTLSCENGTCQGFGCGSAGQPCGSGFDPCCATFECISGTCQECRRELQSCGAGVGSCCATLTCTSGFCQ